MQCLQFDFKNQCRTQRSGVVELSGGTTQRNITNNDHRKQPDGNTKFDLLKSSMRTLLTMILQWEWLRFVRSTIQKPRPINKKTKLSIGRPSFPLNHVPAVLWMILTNAILISMWWISIALKFKGLASWKKLWVQQEKAPYVPPDREPPDITHQQTKRKQSSGENKHKPLQTMFIMGLQAAAAIASDIPNINLQSNKAKWEKVRHRKNNHALLGTNAPINEEDLKRLQATLGDLPQGLLANGDSFNLIFDSGCTRASTGFREDFIDGTLQTLPTPVIMTGIAGGLEIKEHGLVRYQVVTDNGSIKTIEIPAYLMPTLPSSPPRPQAILAARSIEW